MKLSDLLNELEEEENQAIQEEATPNYKMLFFRYFNKWYWFVISMIVCGGLAAAYAYFAKPQYQVTSKLLLKDEKKGADFRDAAITDLLGGGSSSSVENGAEMLKAQNLMVKVFEELNISNAYSIPNGWKRYKEIYGSEVPITVVMHSKNEFISPEQLAENEIIFHYKNEEEFTLESSSGRTQNIKYGQEIKTSLGTISIIKNPEFAPSPNFDLVGTPITINFYDPVGAGKYFAGKLKVDIVNKLASVVELSMLSDHPIKGKAILEKLIEVYNTEAEIEKNITARNTIDFIDAQLVGLTSELDSIEKQAESYKLKNSITDLSAESQLYLSSATVNRQQLSEFSIQIEVLESIEDYLLKQGNDYEMVPSTLSIQDPTLTQLIAQFNQLQRERERMLRTTQPNNPIVLNINQQLTSLRASIIENLRNIKNGLVISRNNLSATDNQFRNRAAQAPTIERELLDISRQQGIKQQHYLLLVQKREEAILTLAASSVNNSKVIEPPTPTDYPVSPNKKLIFAFAILMGFAFPFGFIFLKDAWQEKIQLKSDVERITRAKILGEISRNKGSDGVIAISKGKRTMIAEQFRFIRSNLAFATFNRSNKIIMVTSGMSGEGKTFFSINLAISLGLVDKKVAVLEFDLRKPAMLSALGIDAPIGISDYLDEDKYSLDEIIHPLPITSNVSVLGCGKIPENPAELMTGEKLIHMLEDLSQRFDHVIIDTAPIGLVSDSFILSGLADVTIFMLRYNYSTKAQVKTIEDIRKHKKFKMPLIVLNDAQLEMTYGYGATYGKKYYQGS
jgi:tyrosine-protein kinase Etk/Wzc